MEKPPVLLSLTTVINRGLHQVLNIGMRSPSVLRLESGYHMDEILRTKERERGWELFDNMDETKISNKKISHVNEFLKIKKNLV